MLKQKVKLNNIIEELALTSIDLSKTGKNPNIFEINELKESFLQNKKIIQEVFEENHLILNIDKNEHHLIMTLLKKYKEEDQRFFRPEVAAFTYVNKLELLEFNKNKPKLKQKN
ncbi:MAG: hypothetical protein ACOXZR_04460 [Bacilli bacterium]|jgi:hypothetical protein